jgi:hypothetical protein
MRDALWGCAVRYDIELGSDGYSQSAFAPGEGWGFAKDRVNGGRSTTSRGWRLP